MKRFQMMTVATLAALSLAGAACTDREEAEVESTDAAVTAPANSGAIEGNESPSLSGSSTGSATTAPVESEEAEVENKSSVEAND